MCIPAACPFSIAAKPLQENFVIVSIAADLKLSASHGAEIKHDEASFKNSGILGCGKLGFGVPVQNDVAAHI